MTDLDHCIENLHAMHGHRICVVEQHINEGSPKQAFMKYGELRGLRIAMEVLEQARVEGVESPPEDHYVNLSKAKLQAENGQSEQTSDVEIRGLE